MRKVEEEPEHEESDIGYPGDVYDRRVNDGEEIGDPGRKLLGELLNQVDCSLRRLYV
jgi:hypothetical protein